jgi:hypothetical protein
MDIIPRDRQVYVNELLAAYRATPGTMGVVRKADRQVALDLRHRGIPVEKVKNALSLGAARRIARPEGSPPLPTVRSLAYFLPVIEEVLQMNVGDVYFDHIRRMLAKMSSRTPR